MRNAVASHANHGCVPHNTPIHTHMHTCTGEPQDASRYQETLACVRRLVPFVEVTRAYTHCILID